MTKTFKKTLRQVDAIKLLASASRYLMLYGGSRSGKTFIILYAMIVRASRVKSRHLIVRLKFNHVKTSIWMDTLPKVLSLAFPELAGHITPNNTDFFLKFPNGSEIWAAGLDDKIRTEKILGKEYSTIFFNECSQIPYSSINIAITRLAEKNNLTKKAYFDENPPNKKHWSYPLFVLKKDPDSWDELKSPNKYNSMVLNPDDNRDNIDEDYIDEILDELPEQQRRRFKFGEFTDDGIGLIYYGFDREKNVVDVNRNPKLPIYTGTDFNVNPMTSIIANVTNKGINVFDEIWLGTSSKKSNTHELGRVLLQRYGRCKIVPDATGKALKSSSAGLSDHDILRSFGHEVETSHNPYRMDRYNVVNKMLEKQTLLIDKKCKHLIKDLEQLSFKEGTNLPDLSDKNLGHVSDGLGYLCYKTHGMSGGARSKTIQL